MPTSRSFQLPFPTAGLLSTEFLEMWKNVRHKINKNLQNIKLRKNYICNSTFLFAFWILTFGCRRKLSKISKNIKSSKINDFMISRILHQYVVLPLRKTWRKCHLETSLSCMLSIGRYNLSAHRLRYVPPTQSPTQV